MDYSAYLKTAYATTDWVYEDYGAGYDIVYSRISITLFGEIEEVRLVGDDAADIVGNEYDNLMVGNQANNVLDGGFGIDTLIGGLGDDVYVVDDISDVITEQLNEGRDTIITTVDNYQLVEHVENLYLGVGVNNAQGNHLDNLILGNSLDNVIESQTGNDRIRAAEGNDTVLGGLGDDTYI